MSQTYVRPRLRVVARAEWGARPPRDSPGIPPMVHPAAVVYFTYRTAAAACHDRESCCRALREIQDRQMDEEGAPDINYNFLVGEDLAVYEGRGWNKQPEDRNQYPVAANKVVDIAFIGDYTKTFLPFNLAKIALEFVGNGINNNYLTAGYKLRESHQKLNFDED